MNPHLNVRNAAFSAGLILFTTFFALGCSNSTGTTPNSNSNNSQGNIGAKTLSITVHDEVEQPTGVKIFVVVEIDSNNLAMPLSGSDAVTCNGVGLALDPASNTYKGAIASKPVGQRYTFDLIQGGTTHFLGDVLVTPRPVITYPTQGANITRSKNFAITYQAVGGTAGVASTVRGLPVTLTSPTPESDNGVSTSYDVTSFPAGPGWGQIIRHYQASHVDLGYTSIDANYYTGKVAGVNWQ